MKEINEKELAFVAQHYKEGHLDAVSAWENVIKRESNNTRRWAVAAMAALVVTFSMAIGWYGHQHWIVPEAKSSATDTVINSTEKVAADCLRVYHYNDTPINEVLRDVSAYYQVELVANDSTKHISGEFEASSLQEVIAILESTVQVKITQK